MRVAPTIAMALMAIAMMAPSHAANIDTDQFTMDGVTTYCEGINGGNAGGAMSFPNLYTNSLNRCPILVAITSATTVHQKAVLDVTWKATAKFGDIPGNIFPHAIDQNTKTPQEVKSSFIKACKAGTNCGVVVDGTPVGDGKDVGPFTAGTKALRNYQFTFADQGDFILVGKVTLPGDAALNVSATEFLAFQKIKVVDPSVSIAPSPSPTTAAPTPSSSNSTTPSANNSTGFGGLNNGSAEASVGTVTPSDGKTSVPDVPSDGSKTSSTTSSANDKSFFASHGVLLAIVAGSCVVVFLLGYIVAMRRKKKAVMGTKVERGNARTFRLSRSDQMDDPEPMPYVRKKSARNNEHNNVPIMSRGSVGSESVDGIMDLSKRGSEMEPSFDDDTPSFDEGTVTASNKAVSTLERQTQQQQQYAHQAPPRSSSEVTTDSTKMMLASLYNDDRDTALYQGKKTEPVVRESEEERAFYQSEAWQPAATARPYQRDQSTISIDDNVDSNSSRGGFGAISFQSENDYDLEERHTRFNSEASVDSYAFRPSNVSVAESYKSRVSRYSVDDEMDRESSRISGISLFSDRDTQV